MHRQFVVVLLMLTVGGICGCGDATHPVHNSGWSRDGSAPTDSPPPPRQPEAPTPQDDPPPTTPEDTPPSPPQPTPPSPPEDTPTIPEEPEPPPPTADPPPGPGVVSVSSSGLAANGYSYWGRPNGDASLIVFSSEATNLVANDTNGVYDVFLRDRNAGSTTLLSVGHDGASANNRSVWPTISDDGRYVSFVSDATNLIATPDANGSNPDLFLVDRTLGTTTRVGLDTDGSQFTYGCPWGEISANGLWITFAAYVVIPSGAPIVQVFVRDRATGATELVSVGVDLHPGNSASWGPSITADGRYVAFESGAGNLVAGLAHVNVGLGGMRRRLYLRDRTLGLTTLASVSTTGMEANNDAVSPKLSADGRFMAFESNASNLVSDDTNGAGDIFLRDFQLGTTVRLSVSSEQAQGDGDSEHPWISGDGRYVCFDSVATNMVADDRNGRADIFVRDRLLGTTTRLCAAAGGGESNGDCSMPVLSASGSYVVFNSSATNLATFDLNGYGDVFVVER